MSGTSMDGVDVALVDVKNNQLLDGKSHSLGQFTAELLDKISSNAFITLGEIAKLNRLIAFDFVNALKDLLNDCEKKGIQIEAIGSHGQTVAHGHENNLTYTMQLGCPNTIASLTGIPVVADFRSRDIAYGGQGAPLAPLYHAKLMSALDGVVAVVNIGGIANISFVSQGIALKGYDVGPGNCLLDYWVKKHRQKPYDDKGLWAKQGFVRTALLEQLLNDEFLKLIGPKSLGKEYYLQGFLDSFRLDDYPAVDVQATFLAYTCEAIALAVKKFPKKVDKLIICGGGALNLAILETIKRILPNCEVMSTDEMGLDPAFVEAMMIAWLASMHIHHEKVDLKDITGAKRSLILGNLYMP
tara:strand:- start:78 stop:1145 length:1068 start_codon:yes stop_codon:yes gene_type:complete